jgi:hypothetical protein
LRWGVENTSPKYDPRYFTYSTLFYLNFNGMLDFLKEIENERVAQNVILIINKAAKSQESRFKSFFNQIY